MKLPFSSVNSIHLGKALGRLETLKDSICNFFSQ